MKIILKILQYLLKTIAALLSKISAQHTYTKLWKYICKNKFLFVIYKPLKYLFTNFIYFIKLASAIIAILSLFNLSIIYYDYDILNEINELVNKIINYIRLLWNKWLGNKEEDIEEPIDFFYYKKEVKVIQKAVEQNTNNSYWIIPIMLAVPIIYYYFNPQVNINEILDPIIEPVTNKIEEYLPKEYFTIFVGCTFIHKFIIIGLSYLTGEDLNIFTDDNPKPDEPKFTSGINSEYRKDLQELLNKGKRNNYSPMDDLNPEEREEYEALFTKEEETPKASTSKLPPEIPLIENPFKKVSKYDKSPIDSSQIKTEVW